jgi:hypothetical protein
MSIKPEIALANWTALNALIMKLTEKDVVVLIEHERANRGRVRVLLRLYNRFSKLRSIREKKELAHGSKA